MTIGKKIKYEKLQLITGEEILPSDLSQIIQQAKLLTLLMEKHLNKEIKLKSKKISKLRH